MKPIEEWLNRIHCGNAYELLRQMPSESVDCVVTSPPYYGLRDYGSGADTVFGGDPNCEHEWSEGRMTLVHENRNFLEGAQEEVRGKRDTTYIRKFDDRAYGFCVKCGAWKGQLGLECLSEDTEILTLNGWKKIDECQEGEFVATFNIEKECLEYQPILKIFKDYYEGEMIRIKNSHVDMLVTPNHRVLHKSLTHSGKIIKKTGWKFTLAKDLKIHEGLIIPIAFPINGSESIGCDLAELVGLILTDGYLQYGYSLPKQDYLEKVRDPETGRFRKVEKTKRLERITIYQSKPHVILRIESLLKKLNIPYTKSVKQYPSSICSDPLPRAFIRITDATFCKLIDELIPNKIPSRKLLFLKREELQRLFEGLMEGDGSGYSFYGKSKKFRDWFQILCLHLGKRAILNEKKQSVELCDRGTTFIARRNRRGNPKLEPYGITREFYRGVVWCVKTQNGTFLARRNGKPFITGNSSWRMYVEHLVELFREVKRVLKKTGSFWLNIGDTYAGNRCNSDLPEKCLMGIPWRVAFALVDDGWILRNAVIWYKPSHMPESVKDRLTRTYEYIFHFVKSKKYFYNLDNIREPHKAGDNIEEILRYWGANKHGEYHGKAVKDYESAKAQNASEVKRRIIENLKSKYLATDVGTASPAARSIKMSEKLAPQVKQKILAVGAYLKDKLTKSGYTIKQLAEITGIKQTTLEHYFRTDFSGQMLPSREDWNLLKPLLGLGEYDEYIDEEIRHVLPQPHPIGRNPGDVWSINMTKHDLAVGRVGNFSYTDPLHTKGYYPLGKNPGDLWSINPKPFKDAHFAVFPPELPLRPILASCPPDGVVLDPLAGSGTVAYTCELINRGKWDEFRIHVNEIAKRIKWNLKWIMIEINPEYCKIMEKRLEPFMKQKSLDCF